MWCYQKPGFEALLLAELQRQQQCNQFCDTLLKTDGISVPAHSCILSAISPQISSSLSSMPPTHAGESRFLEFQALGSSTLLQLVRLLYSGQMAGEGEEERQEAISAAARLGIHGLVQVKKRRKEAAEDQHKEVGVQTEPMIPVENEERQSRWRREERDGNTFTWREKMSQGEKDTWTQTEELQVNTAPPSYQAAPFEIIDIGALPTILSTPDVAAQTDPSLSQIQIPGIPVSLVYPPNSNQNQVPSCAELKSWWASAAAEETEQQLEQFQGNISGYIHHFLKQETRRRGRPRGSRASGIRGAGRAGVGERGARRPRASSGVRGRGRGGLTQTVDVQSVGVSKIQKMFLQRWEVRTPRTGQGGGAVGRKLTLKTRELLKQTKKCPRRRRKGGKEWEFGQSGDVREGGEGNLQQGGLNKPTTSAAAFSSPSVRFYNAYQPLPATLQPSPLPSPMIPAASYQHPASSLLHTTPLPPPNLPPNEPEHIDRLLEEVMIGLNILPNKTKNQDQTTMLLETGPRYVSGGYDSRGCVTSGPSVPVLQQQGEGELNDMLEKFLQSFEQHVEGCSTREVMEKEGQSCTEAARSKYRKSRKDKTGSLQSCLQEHTSSPSTLVKSPPSRPRKRRRKTSQFALSLERKRVRVKKPASSSEAKIRTVPDRQDKQLLQMPVVKLKRSCPLPERVKLQGHSCQSLEECAAPTNSSSSSVKYPHGDWGRKVYPTRSKFTAAHITDSLPFLYDPPNKQLGSLFNGKSSQSPVQQQLPSREERNQEKRGEELNNQTNEGPRRTAKKRGAESGEETSSGVTETKRLCGEKSTPATSSASANSATTQRDDGNTSVDECRERLTWREENLEDEEIDVDEDDVDDHHQAKREPISDSPASHSSCEEDTDIDVIGGSCPAPDPVIIIWSDSSGGEEMEEVDVIGDKMEYVPSALLTSVAGGT